MLALIHHTNTQTDIHACIPIRTSTETHKHKVKTNIVTKHQNYNTKHPHEESRYAHKHQHTAEDATRGCLGLKASEVSEGLRLWEEGREGGEELKNWSTCSTAYCATHSSLQNPSPTYQTTCVTNMKGEEEEEEEQETTHPKLTNCEMD